MLFSLTLGNSLRSSSLVPPILGLISCILVMVVPVFIQFDSLFGMSWLNTNLSLFTNSDGRLVPTTSWYLSRIALCLAAAVLALIQCLNIMRILSLVKLKDDSILGRLMAGSATRNEYETKMAAAFKTHLMVKNAYELHKRKDKRLNSSILGITSSTNARALLNFNKYSNETEMTGGFFWLWKGISNGSLLREHGIMINSRLKIANLLQFIILLGAPFIFLSIGKGFIVDEETMQDAQCMSFFDPTNCSAPLNGNLGMLFCPDVNLTSSCKEEFVAPDSESCNFLIDLLGYQETFKFDEISCDSVFMPPRNQQIYSSTVGSVENDFCSITITSCFDFDNDSNSSFQVCLMGAMSSFPYLPFQMKGASKYNDASKYSKCKSIPQLERIANIKENSDIDPPRNGM